MCEKIKVIIAEDHKILRRAYVELLKERQDIQLIGEAGNGKELLDILEQTNPHIILLDLEMPVMKGSEAFDTYKHLYPGIKTIIISNHYTDALVTEFFLKGVNGYISKGCEPEQILEAIDSVINENYYYDSSLSRALLSSILKDKEQKLLIEKIRLTPIELDILKLICEETTTKKIAEKLKLTVYSIENHRRNIQVKTKQSSAIGLFKFAVKNGITEIN